MPADIGPAAGRRIAGGRRGRAFSRQILPRVVAGLQKISTDGGRLPLWSKNGRGLFFSSPNGQQMFTVAVQSGTTFLPGRQRIFFEDSMLAQATGFRPYDIAFDGRFVVIRRSQAKEVGSPESNLTLMQNWFEELKRLVPTK